MKPEGSQTTRYNKEGIIHYSSGSLYHSKHQMRGFMYKKAEKKLL